MTRKLSLVLGILLAAGAFIGVLLVGAVANPSPQHVIVAVTEIQPGTMLDQSLFGIDPQQISPQVAAEYVLRDEIGRYAGAVIIRQMVPGQPLMHRDLVHTDNPAAYRHVALALQDPNAVAMVIPVGENVPDGIVPGDRIAVVWSIGEASFLAGPTGGGSTAYAGYPGWEGAAGAGTLPPEIADLLDEAQAQDEDEVSLPFAKLIVHVAEVIRVRREQQANPAYTGEAGQSPYIEGRVQALEIITTRDEMEAIQFAVANGKYSIAVLSPNADLTALLEGSTMGVMWTDVLDFFQADRLRALGELEIEGPVRPAGASNIYGPILAPTPRPARGAGVPTPPTGAPVTPAVPDEDQAAVETPAEVAEATPAPLPTATPMPVAAVEEPAEPAPPVEPVAMLGGANSLLLGIGCVAGVLGLIGLAVIVAMRALRRRGQPAA